MLMSIACESQVCFLIFVLKQVVRETYHQSQVLPFFRNFSTVPTFELKKKKQQNEMLPISRESEAEEAAVNPQDS